MALEQSPDGLEKDQNMALLESGSMAPLETGEPTVPPGLPESEREELRMRARELVSRACGR